MPVHPPSPSKAATQPPLHSPSKATSSVPAGGVVVGPPTKVVRNYASLPVPHTLHPFAEYDSASFAAEGGLKGPWKVYLTDRAIKAMRKYLHAGDSINIITKKIGELSAGHFSPSNAKKINSRNDGVPLYEAKLSRNLRLVWQVSVLEEVNGNFTQIVLVWSVETHQSLDAKIWDGLEVAIEMKGTQYNQMCARRSEVPRTGHGAVNVFKPVQFRATSENKEGSYTAFVAAVPTPQKQAGLARAAALSDAEQIELHEVFQLAKHVLFDRKVLASVIADDSSSSFLFAVTREESEVIFHPGSSVTIGRSGSGKTTAIVMKIFELYRVLSTHPTLAARGGNRQLFITQSPILADRVKRFFDSLVHTESTASLSREQLLALAAEASHHQSGDSTLLGLDEEAAESGLPPRFSELESHHFPLFVSFERLLRLIEGDLGIRPGRPRALRKSHRRSTTNSSTSRGNNHHKLTSTSDSPPLSPTSSDAFSPSHTSSTTSTDPLNNLHLVDSTTFTSWYSSIDQRLTKNIDPSLAWSEILGVIKGSSTVAMNDRPFLSEEEYVGLSDRVAPSFVGRREVLYRIFGAYQSMKVESGMWDPADRTHAIIEALDDQRDVLTVCNISYLSVDEAQDLLLLDYQLLKMLCPNPLGKTIVGDTAQTIFAGSSFRFQDLTSAFYIDEEALARQEERGPLHLRQFHFSKNFRSHGGITRCANAIVKAIYALFPNAIDQLPDEESAVNGPAPLWIDHSTHPGIIVRNDEARQKLRKELGNTGLILTVFESKGLEFDSVLIYHFFSDSSASASQWRALLNVGHCTSAAIPTFDPIHHSILKSELQHFYVAVTRSRKTVWLREDRDVGEAMKIYLCAKDVLKVADPTVPLPAVGGASTSSEWHDLGTSLFQQKIYREAALAFSRAGAPFLESHALAYASLSDAVSASKAFRANPTSTKAAYAKSAERFDSAAVLAPAERQRVRCFAMAGSCWEKAEMWSEAARSWENSREWEKAAVGFRTAGDFEDAVRIVQDHEEDLEEATASKIIEVSRLQFTRADKLDQAAKLFPSTDAYLEFLDQYGMARATKTILIKVKDYSRAAEVCVQERQFVEASQWFVKAGAIGHARKALTSAIWASISIGSLDTKAQRKEVGELFLQLRKLGQKPGPQHEVQFLSVLLSFEQNRIDLVQLYETRPSTAVCTLLALDAAVQVASTDPTYTTTRTAEYLQLLRAYCHAMRNLFSVPVVEVDLSSTTVQAVFGFKTADAEDEEGLSSFQLYQLLEGSSLSVHLGPASEPGQLKTVDGSDIILAMKLVAFPRLYALLEKLDADLASPSQVALPPCPRHTVANRCDGTCGQPHPPSLAASNAQIKLVIDLAEMMRIYLPWLDHARFPDISHDGCRRMQREWAERLIILATPVRPYVGGDLLELADRVDEQDWRRLRQLLGTYSMDRLWELREFQAHFYASSATTAAVVARDLADRGFVEFYRRFRMCHTRGDFPPMFMNQRGQSIWWVLGHGIEGLGHVQVTDSSVGAIVDFAVFALWTNVRVDTNALLRLIEEVAFLSVLSLRQGATNPWHGIILPRSMAKLLLRKHMYHGQVYITENILDGVIKALVLMVRGLCETLDSQCFLYHGGRTIRGRAYVRHLFIARACQVLALIGMNYTPFRSRVFAALTEAGSYFGQQRVPDRLYNAYLFPTHWLTIENHLLEPVYPREPGEELVALLLPGALPLLPRRGVRTIRGANLHALLDSVSTTGPLSAMAKPFEPAARTATTIGSSGGWDVTSDSSKWDAATTNATQEEKPDAPPDPRQVAAAVKIQAWIRRRQRLLATRTPPSPRQRALRAASAQFAKTAAGLSDTLDGVKLRRKILLGPMVDASFAISESHKLVVERKKKLQKKDLPLLQHEHLELVMGLIAKASDLGKRFNRLIRIATPSNNLLETPESVEAVQQKVREKLHDLASFADDVEQLLAARSGVELPSELKRAFETSLVWLKRGSKTQANGG